MSRSYLGRTDLPLGLRNNNPGNLVITHNNWKGKIPVSQNTDGHFEQFENVAWGIRAMMIDLVGDIREGKNTLRKLINEYAPASENPTTNYINFVSDAVGLLPDVQIQLSKPLLLAIVRAKITFELGPSHSGYVRDRDIEDAYQLTSYQLPGSVLVVDSKKKHLSKSQCSSLGWEQLAA